MQTWASRLALYLCCFQNIGYLTFSKPTLPSVFSVRLCADLSFLCLNVFLRRIVPFILSHTWILHSSGSFSMKFRFELPTSIRQFQTLLIWFKCVQLEHVKCSRGYPSPEHDIASHVNRFASFRRNVKASWSRVTVFCYVKSQENGSVTTLLWKQFTCCYLVVLLVC